MKLKLTAKQMNTLLDKIGAESENIINTEENYINFHQKKKGNRF
jgi:phosphate starvation-inducible protein PhoH